MEGILAAILSVNRFSPKKTWGILPALRRYGLTDPDTVNQLSLEELSQRLVNAGYNRGRLNGKMSGRVQQLMVAANEGHLDDYERLVTDENEEAAKTFLCKISGIGPWVAELSWRLRTNQ